MTMGAARIRALLDEHDLAPSRALGQNFVIDPNTVRRIAALAGVGPDSHALEIGPGLGSLTLALAETGASVTAVEVDRHLVPVLRSVVADVVPPVTVVHGDALEIDLHELLSGAPTWRLAANLPYNVGTTILLRILEEAPEVSGGVVLVQREVAERLAAGPGDAAHGIPSVKTAWWASASVAGRVPPTVFHPRPRVDSALVTLERREPPGDDALRRRVFALVDAGFGQRRKMLRRSLADHLDASAFGSAGVAPTARAEELALDDWVRLAR
ncbi:16S rRNA (adenine(1518)-N(6)/adenine(1519)-N(6))-dimethyltransferase RsmA [Actinospongicola halichondriae]|uniref:16S rRNA (adenine(1518)-N(6)/adenine(1519)-N(6))- dimethyltransferase RsmA n=1 Tax=Actinospongicola halichondriae TaxID=3236844 RepID=UPI003D4D9F3D